MLVASEPRQTARKPENSRRTAESATEGRREPYRDVTEGMHYIAERHHRIVSFTRRRRAPEEVHHFRERVGEPREGPLGRWRDPGGGATRGACSTRAASTCRESADKPRQALVQANAPPVTARSSGLAAVPSWLCSHPTSEGQHARLELVREWAKRERVTPAQFSLGWVMAQSPGSCRSRGP